MCRSKKRFGIRSLSLLMLLLLAASISISINLDAAQPGLILSRTGALSWTNAPTNGVVSLESASDAAGPWSPGRSFYSTNKTNGTRFVIPAEGNQLLRLRAVDVDTTDQGFLNLVYSYGILETIAGSGVGQTDGISYWQPYYEGLPGQWAALSRPHFAMADRAGNVYIADKNSHSILRVSPEGNIYTHAGTHVGGFDGEGPTVATNMQLNFPNGLWVRGDGTVYVLDTENGRVRRVTTNGIMNTLFTATSDGSALGGGRGLWVKDDESLAYFCNNTRLRKWTPSGGLKTVSSGFIELGTLIVDKGGNIIVCDRGTNRVYKVTPQGTQTVIAGNGTETGGGDGYPALETGLFGVRGVWPVPTGGYLLLTHDGCQLWYLDTGGIVHLLLNGDRGRTHYGDGMFFYSPEAKISEGRSVTMDYAGNIIICESDYGYIRRIRFERVPGVD